MREFSAGVATFFAVCILFWILLPPGPTAVAIVALTVTVGVGGTVLIGQREQRKHDDLYRVPRRRPIAEKVMDVKSWEDR